MQGNNKKEILRISIVLVILISSCFVFNLLFKNEDISFSPGDLNESIIATRDINPMFLNQESNVRITVQVLKDIDNLLVAEIVSEGFEIKNKTVPENLIYSDNLVTWFIPDVVAGNYTFNYVLIPRTSSGQLRGKIGVSLGSEEASFQVSGQSDISGVLEESNSHSRNRANDVVLPLIPLDINEAISKENMEKGVSVNISKSKKTKFNLEEQHSITIEDIQKNYVTILIESNPIRINLVVGQSTKLDLNNDKVYDLYIKLDYFGVNEVYLTIKKISEAMEDIQINTEKPINLNLTGRGSNILIKILSASLIVLFLIIITFLLFKNKESRENNKKALIQKARILVAEYRSKGYNRSEIEAAFLERGWSKEDIESVL